jgi:hypothetical protein
MNKPAPSSTIPLAGHHEGSVARPGAPHTKAPTIPLTFRFYSAMKPRRVYPLTVQLPRGAADKASTGAAPLVIKPVIAGAVVTPAEQTLDLTPSGGQVAFQVTPLAKGRLPEARVDVTHHGRLVERVRMLMRGRTQFATWVLFLLTLIIPSVMLYFTSIAPLRGEVPVIKRKADAADAAKADKPGEPKPPAGPPVANRPPAPKPPEGGPPVGGPPPGGPRPADAPADADQENGAQPRTEVHLRAGSEGEVFQYKISPIIRANSPEIPWVIDTKGPYAVDGAKDGLEWVLWGLGYAYQFLCVGARVFYPSFLCAAALLALTVISLVARRTVRATIRKKGIRLTDPAMSGPARSNSHEEPATVVEAVD